MTNVALSEIPRVVRSDVWEFSRRFHLDVVDQLYQAVALGAPRKTGTLQNSVFVTIGGWAQTTPEKRKYGAPYRARARRTMKRSKLKDRVRISVNQNYAQVVDDRTGWIDKALATVDV